MKKTTVSTIIENARVALAEFKSYSQQQADLVAKTVGKAIYDNAKILTEEAVEETGYGRVDSKIIKQCRSTLGAWHYLHDKKSVGVIEEDTMNQLVMIYLDHLGHIQSKIGHLAYRLFCQGVAHWKFTMAMNM